MGSHSLSRQIVSFLFVLYKIQSFCYHQNMALELQPVTKTKVSRTTSSRSEKRWIKVFNSLAGIQDGDEAEIGLTSGSKGAIDLKKLKEYLQSESSKKLAEDT